MDDYRRNHSGYFWNGEGYSEYRDYPVQHHGIYNRRISIEDAIRTARMQVPGEVTKAELESKGGRLVYEVEIITPQGVNYEVLIDVDTGAVISVKVD